MFVQILNPNHHSPPSQQMVSDFNVALGGVWQYPEKRSVGKNIPKKKNDEKRGGEMLAMGASRGKCKRKDGSCTRRRAATLFSHCLSKDYCCGILYSQNIFGVGCDSLPAVKVRERKLIRCNSGTDGIVRMKEESIFMMTPTFRCRVFLFTMPRLSRRSKWKRMQM